MKAKRIMCAVLATAMAASALVGCGSSKAESEADSGVISMVSVLNQNIKPEDTTAWKYFSQNGKYQFDVDSFDRDVLTEKVNLMLSTNQYPDVFFKCSQPLTWDTIVKYGSMGTFIPLNDLIEEHAPNLSKLIEERPVILEYITADDGNIYTLPSLEPERSKIYPQWINKSWLDRLGRENPTSIEELYEVLTAFKEQDANGNGDPNDEIPVMMSIDPAALVYGWCYMVGQPVDAENKVAVIDGKLYDCRANDKYKEMLSWIAKFYQEGLLDKNIFTQTVAQAQAVGKAADVTGLTGGATPMTYCGSSIGLNFEALNPFYDVVDFRYAGVNPGALVITDKCEDPAKVIEWVDQFYSEEGGLQCYMGQEDSTYRWVDDAKVNYEWIIPEGQDMNTVRIRNALQGIGYTPTNQPEQFQAGNPNPLSQIAYQGVQLYLDHTGDYFPRLTYASADSKTIASIEADISAYADTYAAKIATGELDLDESWDDYLAQLESMGLSNMLEIKQAAYDKAIN